MKNKISRFIIITFLISWIVWGVLGLLSNNNFIKFGDTLYWILFIIGGCGPLIASFIFYWMSGNKDEYKNFLNRIIKVKVNPFWYLWVGIIPLILFSIPWVISYISEGWAMELFRQELYMVFTYIPLNIIGGGTEEIGWRGVLLPELMKKFSKIKSTLILSVIWAVWHYPLFFINGSPQYKGNLIFFTIFTFCLAFLLTTLYTRTESIFLCILFHAFTNSYSNILNIKILNIYREVIIMLFFSIAIFFIHEKIKAKENSDILIS